MSHMTIGELIDTVERGEFDIAAKQVLRYGIITEDKTWQDQTNHTTISGHHRHLKVNHHNVLWSIKKHNGSVTYIQPIFNHG